MNLFQKVDNKKNNKKKKKKGKERDTILSYMIVTNLLMYLKLYSLSCWLVFLSTLKRGVGAYL